MKRKIFIFLFVLLMVPGIANAAWFSGGTLRGELITNLSDPNVVFAAEAAADTQKTYTHTASAAGSYGEYEFDFYNPSTVTDLTVKVMAVLTSLGGDTRYGYITSFSIPKSDEISGTTINTYVKYVTGVFNGANLQLIISNDTVLGVGEGFTCTLRIRAVK